LGRLIACIAFQFRVFLSNALLNIPEPSNANSVPNYMGGSASAGMALPTPPAFNFGTGSFPCFALSEVQ
jgi:hypothetical protein